MLFDLAVSHHHVIYILIYLTDEVKFLVEVFFGNEQFSLSRVFLQFHVYLIWVKMSITGFPLISAHVAYLVSNPNGAVLIGGRRLKESIA